MSKNIKANVITSTADISSVNGIRAFFFSFAQPVFGYI